MAEGGGRRRAPPSRTRPPRRSPSPTSIGTATLDLVVGYADRADEIWRNDGLGGFSVTQVTLSDGETSDLVAADLDCDGALDLLVAEGASTGVNRVYVAR